MAKVLLSCPPSPKTAPWPLDSPTAVGHRERWREKTWANQAERPGKGIVINSIPCRFAKHASQHPIQKKTHSPWTHSTHDAVIFSNFLWSFWLVRFCTGLAPDLSRQSCSRRALSVQSMKLWLANFAFLCFLLFVLQCLNGHLHETALFIQNSNNNLPFESFWYLGEDNGTRRLILTTRKSLRPGLLLYGSTIWSHCAVRCSHIKSWHLLQHQLMAEKLCSKAEETGYRNGQISDARKHPNGKSGYEWFHGRIVPEYRFRHLRNVVHPCRTVVGKKVEHDLQYACT